MVDWEKNLLSTAAIEQKAVVLPDAIRRLVSILDGVTGFDDGRPKARRNDNEDDNNMTRTLYSSK